MLNALTNNTTPQTYSLKPKDGRAWIDVDRNAKIDDSDAFLTLDTPQGQEYVDQADLFRALKSLGAEKQPVSDTAVLNQLKSDYEDPSLQGLSITNGAMNFDMLSTYRHKQSFQLQGEEINYTLQFDPEAPLKAAAPEEDVISLVQDADGVLRWQFS